MAESGPLSRTAGEGGGEGSDAIFDGRSHRADPLTLTLSPADGGEGIGSGSFTSRERRESRPQPSGAYAGSNTGIGYSPSSCSSNATRTRMPHSMSCVGSSTPTMFVKTRNPSSRSTYATA